MSPPEWSTKLHLFSKHALYFSLRCTYKDFCTLCACVLRQQHHYNTILIQFEYSKRVSFTEMPDIC